MIEGHRAGVQGPQALQGPALLGYDALAAFRRPYLRFKPSHDAL